MMILIKDQQRHRRLNKAKIEKTVRKILSLLKHPSAELSILFVSDKKMKQLNASYRGKQNTTDVLSFEAEIPASKDRNPHGCEPRPLVLGDIVISIPKAAVQAKMTGIDFYDEVYRLLIHGVLHLSGYSHENSRYRAAVMRKKEKELFNAIKKIG